MKDKFYQFMQGRYGNDQLSTFIIIAGCIINLLLSLFIPREFAYLRPLGSVLYIWAFWRIFSKNTLARQKENIKFMQKIKPWVNFIYKKANQKKDKEHKYYDCPECHRTLRVPANRGKIEISCPHCGKKFKKRT